MPMDRNAQLGGDLAVRSSLSESITTIWSISGTRSMSAPFTRLMTVPIVFSSLSAGRPRLIVRFWRSLSATSLRMSENSWAWNVFSANHLSTTTGSDRLRSTKASAWASVPSEARSSSKVASPSDCFVFTTITVGLALLATDSANVPNR